jgi:hypothetical protein
MERGHPKKQAGRTNNGKQRNRDAEATTAQHWTSKKEGSKQNEQEHENNK